MIPLFFMTCSKLKKEGNQLVSATTQLKLQAAHGKKYNKDVLDK